MMSKNFLSLIVVIVAIVIAGFLYKRYKVPPPIDLPVLALTDLHGQTVSLQSYAGRPLFLSFFATWCGPCMRELPELADLKANLSSEQLQVVCICDEPLEKLLPLQAKLGDRIIILHSAAKFHDIGIYTYPTNYIYNAGGKKVYNKVDPDSWESTETVNKIKQLLQQ